MALHKVKVVVKGALQTAFIFYGDGEEITLRKNGNTREGEKDIADNNGSIVLTFKGQGLAGTKWSIAITIDDADKPQKEDNGRLTSGSVRKEYTITVAA
ncbi:MAG TPA: hypothetical protein PLZ36_02140 [Armatimonadota bacterium]|nr:hypothetical protein [Armatimonadota bacterium]